MINNGNQKWTNRSTKNVGYQKPIPEPSRRPMGKIYEVLSHYSSNINFREYHEGEDLEDYELKETWKMWKLGPILSEQLNEKTTYIEELKCVGTFNSIRVFLGLYLTIRRPNEFEMNDSMIVDISVFKDGIVPIWEDKTNMDGGKLQLMLKKSETVTNRIWELIIFNILGGELDSDELCGAILSIRNQRCTISIWFKSPTETPEVNRIKQSIKDILKITETNINILYKLHRGNSRTN